MTRSLITGLAGQDGSYLSELLIAAGDDVHGTVRPGAQVDSSADVHEVDLAEEGALGDLILRLRPDRIYNLAAVSSVQRSWDEPLTSARINGMLVVELFAAARELHTRGHDVRVVQASSAEIFGAVAELPARESTPIRPTSTYGAAKAYAHQLVAVHRAAGMFASACILYNHESPRRPTTFVTRKITLAAAAIAAGRQDVLELGSLSARRDWGWAPDYVDALMRAAEAERPDDYVIATGRAHSVEDFVALAFARVGIDDWRSVVRTSAQLQRPTEVPEQVGDAAHAREVLGWAPTVDFEHLVAAMVDADVEGLDELDHR
jgi:GDPmannose 4,6-dehydratase